MRRELRIIYMGTPDFAVPSLQILIENGFNVVGVITAPDRKSGRGQKLNQSAVKQFAVENGLNVLQPTNLKDPEFLNELAQLKANLQIVVAFRMMPKVLWNMPEFGTFNLHGSLLPQYRGAAPINWAIINGEKESGVTTFFLNETIDTGSIILQDKVKLNEHITAGELHDQLMEVGKQLVLDTVKRIETDNFHLLNQKDLLTGKLKEAPKIYKDTCKIDWNENIDTIYNKVRGLSPYPAAWSSLTSENGKKLSFKIFKVEKSDQPLAPLELYSDKTDLIIGCKKGSLKVLELQLEGKKRMQIQDLLRGYDFNKVKITI